MTEDPRRLVPRTDALLADARVSEALSRHARSSVLSAVRHAQEAVRRGDLAPALAVEEVLHRLPRHPGTQRRVLNATGVVVHTNLGRAPLGPGAVAALTTAAGYVDLEYDTATGRRTQRGRGALGALAAALPDAGDVLVVNNGAAALLLALTVLAADGEIVWGRGELVEIGDGFRLPDLAVVTGARLREVGTTNRTTVEDYAAAVGPSTGCLLKVHPSNFRVEGFTSAPPVGPLAALGVPLVVDVGSGQLRPDPLLPDEPDVTTTLRQGATVVTASGDKLLGGPQAGIVAGDAGVVQRMRRHPLARALRADKLALSALEATLLGPPPPVWEALHADPSALEARCRAVAREAGGSVVACEGAVGGGGAPGTVLRGWAVALPVGAAESLRTGDPCVVGRVEHGRCLVDLRCVPPAADAEIVAAIRRCT